MWSMNDANAPEQQYSLALKIVDLAKAQIVADNHFLSAAIGQLRPARAKLCMPDSAVPGGVAAPASAKGAAETAAGATATAAPSFATDARILYIDPANLLASFVADGEPPTHDLLHTILHCVFLHPFVGANIRQDDWDLACNMACELVASQICGRRKGMRGADIEHAFKKLASKMEGSVTAENIYAALRSGDLDDERESWQALFASDDHSPWYRGSMRAAGGTSDSDRQDDDDSLEQDEQGTSREGHGVRGDDEASSGTPTDGGGNAAGKPADDRSDPNDRDDQDDQAATGTASGTPGETAGNKSMLVDAAREPGRGSRIPSPAQSMPEAMRLQDAQEAEQRWRKVARSLSVDLRTISKNLGEGLGDLLQGLDRAGKQTADYREFLRKFATSTEVMRLSDDEFDATFYTYGLTLYKNMPLVEPLEYRVDRRVREFVIAIDTSGSVYGDKVRDFVALTYDVLKSSETFDERVKVKIIQCDTEVRHIDEVDSLDELRSWCGKMQVFGGGGTDFRPVFECVDSMVEQGELDDLGGLIYLTDGYGTYPSWVPGYKTAFVFCDDDHDESGVPPWAMRVSIDPEHMGTAGWREATRSQSGSHNGRRA